MIVYRLTKRKYSSELSGKGAALFANRWNSKGTEVIYTAESRALAMAEVAVHLTLATLPSNYVMMEIEIPDKVAIKEVSILELPKGWNNHPPITFTQKTGDKFVDDREALILKVPSAVVFGDFNYLLNPNHPGFKKIKIKKLVEFRFDRRSFE